MVYTDDDSRRRIFIQPRMNRGGGIMGQLIEYYVPAIFIPRQPRWTDLQQRGRILEFQKAGAKKSA
jgi:hypothetical protein